MDKVFSLTGYLISVVVQMIVAAIGYGIMKQQIANLRDRDTEKESRLKSLESSLTGHITDRTVHTDRETINQLREDLNRRLTRIEEKIDSLKN